MARAFLLRSQAGFRHFLFIVFGNLIEDATVAAAPRCAQLGCSAVPALGKLWLTRSKGQKSASASRECHIDRLAVVEVVIPLRRTSLNEEPSPNDLAHRDHAPF
jgi:hypothetical protein